MCGIIGYTGHRPAVPLMMEGLSRLEYRGYDSAGVAFLQAGSIEMYRAEGKLLALEKKLDGRNIHMSTCGIGHTRWATHGLPVERNAHPHSDNDKSLVLIHNGIFENYKEHKERLTAKGCHFFSDTDTEVMANLINESIKETKDNLTGLSQALAKVEGAYAISLLCLNEPGVLYAARQASPLMLGIGTGEYFVASDASAFLEYTKDVVFLAEGELVKIDETSWQVFHTHTLTKVEKKVERIPWDAQSAKKSGYKHFMLKEIFEQPQVLQDCLAGRLGKDKIILSEIENLGVPRSLHIIACGTSYHAGLWGMQILESLARVKVRVEIASEFRYRDMVLGPDDTVLAISQSGETADTLAGIKKARKKGATVIGLCNVVGSSVARQSDYVLYTQAGPEISVASTKAMCSQLALLFLLALLWGEKSKILEKKVLGKSIQGLAELPGLLENSLPDMQKKAKALARQYAGAKSFMYLGRGLFYPLALEGALKLKEISYIHAEGYAAGEIKHGPIALIDPALPTFALALCGELLPKVQSGLKEIAARMGKIIALTNKGTDLEADETWIIPELKEPLNSFLALPCLQLFAYEMADYLGKDVDQPRNLAKSVTVE